MAHTPGPWVVKEVQGQLFVAATPYEGHPYFGRSSTIEVLSDEDYPTKEADVRLIANLPALLESHRELVEAAVRYLDHASPLNAIELRRVVAKAKEIQP